MRRLVNVVPTVTTRQVIVLAAAVALILGTIPSLLAALLLSKAEASFVSRQVAECERNDQTRAAVTEIITEVQQALRDFYDAGKINKPQFEQALARSGRNASLVRGLDCDRVVRGMEGNP